MLIAFVFNYERRRNMHNLCISLISTALIKLYGVVLRIALGEESEEMGAAISLILSFIDKVGLFSRETLDWIRRNHLPLFCG
jgi:hypothetical protein